MIGGAIRERRLPVVRRADDHGFGQLLQRLAAYLPAEDLQVIVEAHDFATKAHEGQNRRSGEIGRAHV